MGARKRSKAPSGSKSYEAKAIEAYLRKEITAADLQASLGITRTYMYRRIDRYKEFGAEGLVSRKLGNRNRAHPEEARKTIMALVKEHYADFGPKFASEKLKQRHGIRVGAAMLRNWMIEEGIWETRRKKEPRIHQLREPRPQRGELVQVDGSYHRWFEKRGPEACLIVFIDDATSELMALRLVDHESSYNYMMILKGYIETHGRPRVLYSDRHSIFRSTNPTSTGQRNPTQFALACRRVRIGTICAASRANGARNLQCMTSQQGVPLQRRSGVPFGRRLILLHRHPADPPPPSGRDRQIWIETSQELAIFQAFQPSNLAGLPAT